MMKETNIQSQVTSTIAGDDGEAMAKSEGYVAENGFVATDPTHFGKTMINSRGKRFVREAVFLPPLSLWELRTKILMKSASAPMFIVSPYGGICIIYYLSYYEYWY